MAQAVVLAGGASRRLGRPKALVDFLDGTVLSTFIGRLVAHGVETVAVVHPDLAEITADLPCRVVVNPRPEDGRTGSVHLGLAELGASATDVLICPVDRPGWDRGVLEALLNTSGEAVVPAHEGRAGHPLLVRGEALVRIAALAKNAPLRDALPSRTVVEVDAPYLHVNLDQPQDLEALPALQAWVRRGQNP